MIPEYKNILFATDLSHNSLHIFRHVVSLARRYDAKVYLIHVMPEIDQAVLNEVLMVMGRKKLNEFNKMGKDEMCHEVRLELAQFAKEELQDHPEDQQRIVSINIVQGNPALEILLHADQIDADLIVMGSHGKGHLHYAFLGSVAEKLLRKSMRPTMVIPLGPKQK